MPKFTSNLSAARQRLKAALADKAAAVDDIERAQVKLDRLAAVAAPVGPIEAELALLDANESQVMATWAESSDGDPAPKAAVGKRAELVAALAEAKAQAVAASAAMSGPRAAADAASKRASAAHKSAWIASRLVLCDEAMTTLPALRKAIDTAFAEKRRIDAARQSIMIGLTSDDPAATEVFRALGDFDRSRLDAESRPMPLETNEFISEWRLFADRLVHSATASIDDDGAALPRPPIADMTIVDPVVAMARQIESFDSASVVRS